MRAAITIVAMLVSCNVASAQRTVELSGFPAGWWGESTTMNGTYVLATSGPARDEISGTFQRGSVRIRLRAVYNPLGHWAVVGNFFKDSNNYFGACWVGNYSGQDDRVTMWPVQTNPMYPKTGFATINP